MKEKSKIIIGNVTTIITTISFMIGGLILGVLTAHGLNIPISESGLAGVIGLIITTAFAYINAKYHCTFFNEDTDEIIINLDNLTDEEITAIQQFIENIHIADIDPASEYEE